MAVRRLLFMLLAVVLATVAAPAYAQGSGTLKNAVILIIRHAEQPPTGDGLSSAGEARARAYVAYFKDSTIDGRPLRLDYLFAAQDSANSRRPGLTLGPTAQAFGLSIDSRFANKQVDKLVDAIRQLPPGSVSLICWHHGMIPALLRALAIDPGTLLPRGKWPSNVYGWVIELRYDDTGQLHESKRVNEHLMPDD